MRTTTADFSGWWREEVSQYPRSRLHLAEELAGEQGRSGSPVQLTPTLLLLLLVYWIHKLLSIQPVATI